MSPTPAIHTASASTSARGSHTPSARLTRRSATTLAFAGLTFALCVMKALGWEVEYELLIFTASVAGLDSVAGIVRGSVGVIGGRLAERALRSDGGARDFDEGDDEGNLVEQEAPQPVRRGAVAESGRSGLYPVLREIEPGRVGLAAFNAYNAGGSDPRFINRNFQGALCPAWDDLSENVREKWAAVGKLALGLACGETWAEDAIWGLRWPTGTDAVNERLDDIRSKAAP